MKASSTVLNGEGEETYRKATRLALPTALAVMRRLQLTRGEPMDQHARDTLAELGLRLADALHALTEELRESAKNIRRCGNRSNASRKRSAPPRAAPPPGERQAPWRRYGRATAGSLMPASSARPPASMPRSSPPRPRSAAVAMCLGTTTPSTAGAASVPAPGSRPACSQRRTDDLPGLAPGPGPSPPPASGRCAGGWPTSASRNSSSAPCVAFGARW